MMKAHCDFCDEVITPVVGEIFGQALPNKLAPSGSGDGLIVTTIHVPGPPLQLSFGHVCSRCIRRAIDRQVFSFELPDRVSTK